MAKQSIETIKQWFETGDYPTQQQFWDWLDSFIHRDSELAVANITNLEEILIGKADVETVTVLAGSIVLAPGTTTFDVPAGLLVEKILVIAPTPISFKCGTTLGGNELVDTFDVPQAFVFPLDQYFPALTTIYFSGVSGDTIIKILKR